MLYDKRLYPLFTTNESLNPFDVIIITKFTKLTKKRYVVLKDGFKPARIIVEFLKNFRKRLNKFKKFTEEETNAGITYKAIFEGLFEDEN